MKNDAHHMHITYIIIHYHYTINYYYILSKKIEMIDHYINFKDMYHSACMMHITCMYDAWYMHVPSMVHA